MDNRGHRMIVTDDSAINTPAIAAAHVIRRYTAQAADEISFEVSFFLFFIKHATFFLVGFASFLLLFVTKYSLY